MKKKMLLALACAGLSGALALPSSASAQPVVAAAPTDFCFYTDPTPAASEMPWKAIQCWQQTNWWVNGYSGIKLIKVINSTARKYQMTGYNLHPTALVDWDSAAQWGHAAGYGVYINP